MYRELLADEQYESAQEYAILRTLAEEEFEEEIAGEEFMKEQAISDMRGEEE